MLMGRSIAHRDIAARRGLARPYTGHCGSRSKKHFSKLLDIEMIVHAGGRERTHDEYAALLRRAGFRLDRIVPTASPISIVEASPG